MARVSLIAASGLCAGLAALAALAVAAERRNRSPWRPINATSHWIHGPRSGSVSRPDLAHTGTGFTTHMLASFWWALPFSAMIGRSARPSPSRVVAAAAGTTALAALVDYGLVPKRLTPGWELALPKSDLMMAYVAMGLGLVLGTYLHAATAGTVLPFDDQEQRPS
ncbi:MULTISPECIES: hypothetical protein [Sinorhizobium]|uniref:hypothetical protein n=1 Tax=Sinorhizobium TaxID=28105 RepID=UPI000374E06B|nr:MULTISPECIES: hypothetical protein [Sinorhizobium]PND24620.1 hypothetical protein CN933_25505 [Sinorhizobium sp. M4_45]